ncbi:N-acetylglucosaminyl-diphospho-decaprenol L-rhamnosyltransferase [Curtobacterium sp. PhB130]|uniref:glycosyltransferase family 2 protein n=1 Tax=unclassified Curtobacterium TaxID=257496 RepID=UPI000F4C5AFB|nr:MULTISPECIES: glycosyltransferase family 2 protein [unclassified Curtobacterium]ROS76385.1 N-acetylglucosaminyl-diphospho-decaprenol L-rhamnosyltransferase [Curtobacterium sp. PhB130]TCK59716.1 N-acetylglucosaminyl-diphospho-decaprenol L-rhamnosyltransferase [Curtobacterium sp. PhB136]
MSARPRVAVLTVTYNTGETIRPFLESAALASDGPLPVVIADNGSDDLDALRAIAEAHGAVVVSSGSNRGYGGGIDAAFAALDDVLPDERPEFILVTNPDVVFRPGSVDELVAAADRLPRGGSFGPQILDEHGETYPSARQLPSLRTGLGHAAFSRFWPGNPWSQRYWSTTQVVERDAGWLSGACFLIRTSLFRQLGGFDESYFMYFEDVDLGQRVGRSGHANVYVPSATVVHTGAHSTSSNRRRMEVEHHRSAYRFLSRKYRAWWLWPLRVVLRTGLAVRARWVTRK